MKKRIIVVILAVCLLIYLIPLLLIINSKNSRINNQVDYLVVLGAKINHKMPSKMLKYRLDEAFIYFQKYPDTKIIVTGGQGQDEDYSEAFVMKEYLINKGIPENQIIEEDKSVNTFENLKNSKSIAKIAAYHQVGVVTNGFHSYRSRMLCQRVFLHKCQIQTAANHHGLTKAVSFAREPFAFYKSLFIDN